MKGRREEGRTRRRGGGSVEGGGGGERERGKRGKEERERGYRGEKEREREMKEDLSNNNICTCMYECMYVCMYNRATINVLPVSEWCDDQPWCVTKILVRVHKLSITYVSKAVLFLFVPSVC